MDLKKYEQKALEKIGKVIRKVRQKKKISQSILAKSSGISVKILSSIERGVAEDLDLRLLSNIMTTLDTEIKFKVKKIKNKKKALCAPRHISKTA